MSLTHQNRSAPVSTATRYCATHILLPLLSSVLSTLAWSEWNKTEDPFKKFLWSSFGKPLSVAQVLPFHTDVVRGQPTQYWILRTEALLVMWYSHMIAEHKDADAEEDRPVNKIYLHFPLCGQQPEVTLKQMKKSFHFLFNSRINFFCSFNVWHWRHVCSWHKSCKLRLVCGTKTEQRQSLIFTNYQQIVPAFTSVPTATLTKVLFMPKKLSVVHFCRVHNYQIFTFTFRSDCKKNLSTLTIWNWTKACACIPVIVNRISIHILKSDFLGHTDKFDLSCYIQRFILNIIKSTFHSTVSDGWLWLCLQ